MQPVRWRRDRLLLLDQTQLPARVVYRHVRNARQAVEAIVRLRVRGAPAIGVAAAAALVVEARRLADRRLFERVERAGQLLRSARPTAVNLAWAVDRVLAAARSAAPDPARVRLAVRQAAQLIAREEIERTEATASAGARLLRPDSVVLTICNTGPLAGTGIGTALGVVLRAHAAGKRPRVFACETRPLLQGARLTTLELMRAGVVVTLIVDSAAASVVGSCDAVLVGADRVARNGDTANKVGTRMLAVLARHAGIPFYVVAPSSTFDHAAAAGRDIPVEQRGPEEVRSVAGRLVAPRDVPVFNPAFDVTPARLISGFVTEHGVLRPPFGRAIRRLLVRSRTTRKTPAARPRPGRAESGSLSWSKL
jgi:methylthioribose-1-phosphate isomerase